MKRYMMADEWHGRIDSIDDIRAFRWHQIVTLIDLTQEVHVDQSVLNICFLGFCCDEGVKRNMGRPGAFNGPQSIREEMANWPASFIPKVKLYDAGNIICEDDNLESAQEELSEAVCRLKESGFFTILLGGGHEIALGHYNGLVKYSERHQPSSVPAIINFDAHLDIRPYADGGSSGTMFNQIYHINNEKSWPFSYLCIGPQTYANTPFLFNLADEMGVDYILAKDISVDCMPVIRNRVKEYASSHKDIYLTICTDVLSASHAPGVSAVQPFGLEPDVVLGLIKEIIRSGNLSSIDIAEVSPRFDADNRTAKLVAVFIYAIINTLLEID